jgi:hypothetical protein
MEGITMSIIDPARKFGLRGAACLLLMSAFAASATPQVSPSDPIKVLGDFQHITHTTEDAFGYSLQLWKQGNQVFGLLFVYLGPPSDPPAGLLEDVKFDPRTKQLSFSARLSTGVRSSGAGKWDVPSRDRYSFRGVLSGREVVGTLKESDDLSPKISPRSKRIRLRRSVNSSELMNPPPATYSAWKTWADEILERRGPKW